MGYRESEDHLIQSINMLKDEIFSFDLDAFAEQTETAVLTNDLNRIQKLLRTLSLVDLTLQDSGYLQGVDSNLRQLRNYIRELKIVLKDEKRKSEIDSRVRDVSESCSNLCSPIFRILTSNLVLNAQDKFALVDILSDISIIRDKSLEDSKKILAEMEVAQKNVEDMYAKAVVAKHAGNFNTEGLLQMRQAVAWLIVSIGLVGGLVWYSDFHIAPSIAEAIEKMESTGGKTALAQIAISKTVIFSVFAYMVIVSIRNFSAHKHNWTVNNHRRNALSTFETFLECSNDKQVREVALPQFNGQ